MTQWSLLMIHCLLLYWSVFICGCDIVFLREGHVESLLLTNSNATTFQTPSMQSSTMTSSDDSVSGWSDDDADVVRRRSLVYIDGRAGTLRCVAVSLSSPVRVEVYIGRRNVTGSLRATRAVTAGGRPGLRRLRYAVELARYDFRPGVDDTGRRLTCTAYVHDQPANATSVRLVVRRKSHRPLLTAEFHSICYRHIVKPGITRNA